MKSKKILSCTLALMLSLGTLTVLPEQLNDKLGVAITADAAANDFIINTDYEGKKYIDGYKGAGGNVVIPKDIDYINNYAFEGCYKITSITAEGDLNVMGNAFQGCTRLNRVVVKGNAFFDDYAFNKCVELERVEVGGSITNSIGKCAFSNCTLLRTFKVNNPGSAYKIDKRAFFNCINLTAVTITSSCNQIADEAFLNCPRLGSLTIPSKTKIAANTRPFGYTIGLLASDVEKPAINYNYAFDFDLDEINEKVSSQYYGKLFAIKYVFNDGSTPVYIDYFSPKILSGGTNWSYFYDSDFYKLYGIHDRVLPRKISLKVVRGSNAETYASKNKLDYTYYTEEAPRKILSAPNNIEVSAKTKSSITLKWDKVSGASSYNVYLFNLKTGEYEKYKNVKTNSCLIKGLEKNTKYKIKVAAVSTRNGKITEGKRSGQFIAKTKSK